MKWTTCRIGMSHKSQLRGILTHLVGCLECHDSQGGPLPVCYARMTDLHDSSVLR